ncbi:TPA: hypothetical protein ACHVA2_001636 [Streptococcus suis]
MEVKEFENLSEYEMEKIFGGCSWGGLTRSVIKGGGDPAKTAFNAGLYALTCWW